MRLREHTGIIPGRIDILYCRPEEITEQDGYNVRDLTTTEARTELDELKAQIKENGILTPLKVRFNGTDIILVEGHRRRLVALELIAEYKASDGANGRNIEAVPIFPESPGTTDIDRDVGLEISNSGSRLKPLELANLIHRLNTKHGLPLEAVADRLGKSTLVVKNTLALRGLSEPIKQHVNNGEISATLARNIAKGVDPIEAEKMIRANLEENKRLGIGKRHKTRSKVTRKTLQRDAKPKSDYATADAARRELTNEGADHSALSASSAQIEPVAPEIEERVSVSETDGSGNDTVVVCIDHGNDPAVPPTIIKTTADRVLYDRGDVADPLPAPHRVPQEVTRALLALRTFALIAEEQCVGERDDSEKIEAPAIAYKQAWEAYQAVAGDVS